MVALRIDRRILLSTASAVALTVTSCSTSSSEVSKSLSSADDMPTVPAAGSPVDRSEYPVGSEWRLHQSWASPESLYRSTYDLWQQGVRTCMESYGFNYQPYRYVGSDEFGTLLNPLNEAVAANWGYHEPPAPEPEDLNIDASESFFEALVGGGRCADRASAFVYDADAISAWSEAQGALTREVDEVVVDAGLSSPEISSTISTWSECMASGGYEYAAPSDAWTEFGLSPTPTQDEIAVRLADLECDRDVGLTRRRSELEQRAIEDWTLENESRLGELRVLMSAAEEEVLDLTSLMSSEGLESLPGSLPPAATVEVVPPTTPG